MAASAARFGDTLAAPASYGPSCGLHQTPARPRGCSSPRHDTPAEPVRTTPPDTSPPPSSRATLTEGYTRSHFGPPQPDQPGFSGGLLRRRSQLSKPPAGKRSGGAPGAFRRAASRVGQKGHEGETLRHAPNPTLIIIPSCPNCGSGLTPEMSTGHGARQVFDLPEPRPLVVMEHRAHRCRCGRCGRQTRAPFPLASPARCGMARGSGPWWSTCRTTSSCPKIVWPRMADLFAVALVPATVARMGRSRARRFEGVVEVIRDLVKSAPVKHMDETACGSAGGPNGCTSPC